MSPKGCLKIFAFTLLLIFIMGAGSVCFFLNSFSTYAFTIPDDLNPEIDKYNPSYVGTDYLQIAKILHVSEKPYQSVKTEFMVLTNDFDIETIPEVKTRNYLFSAVLIRDPYDGIINVSHYYNNKELQPVAEYIFYETGASVEEQKKNLKKRYSLKKVSSPYFNEKKSFMYVRIYKTPRSFKFFYRYLLPQSYWFNDSMHQKINLKFKHNDKVIERNFDFDLKWREVESFTTFMAQF